MVDCWQLGPPCVGMHGPGLSDGHCGLLHRYDVACRCPLHLVWRVSSRDRYRWAGELDGGVSRDGCLQRLAVVSMRNKDKWLGDG